MFKENEKTELKEIYTPDLKKEIIAFFNTNGGVIYIGVTDDGQIVGVSNVDETALQITNSIRDSIKPDITIFINLEILQIENKDIIKITVEEGSRKPYYIGEKGLKSSGVYIRQGTSSANASEDAIRNMIKLSDGNSFELNRSLNQDLHFEVLENEFKLRKLEFGRVQQKNLFILSNDDMYTNLGLLVSDECKHSIKYAIFQGTDKSVFKDRKEFNGSIFKQLNDVYDTINFYNGTSATFDKLIRVDERDYPEVAIREALLNAIVHRDYSFSGSIIINQYEDRLEFISLGGLVQGLSLDAIFYGASQPRNEKLANLFYRMRLIEAYGTGISKISDCYKNNHIKPSFESAEGVFRVVLPNLNSINAKRMMEVREKFYNDHRNMLIREIGHSQIILGHIKLHGKITRPEVEDICNIGTSRSIAILKDLLEDGKILRVGNGKKTHYILK